MSVRRALVIGLLLAAVVAFAETSWKVGGKSQATYPNQGHRLVMDGANLHFVCDRSPAEVMYTYSTDKGSNWSTPEKVDFGETFGDYMGCVATSRVPWVIGVTYTSFDPPLVGLEAAVRRGAENYINSVLGPDADDYHSLSMVMSPSGGSDPMAYALAAVTVNKSETQDPDMYDDLYFVAWDTSNGYPTVRCQSLVASAPAIPGYGLRGSIAVSGHSGNDTIHIAYQKRVGVVSRILYVKNTNQINPGLIRSSTSPTWSTPDTLSTPSDPTCQPATNPSIEFDDDCDSLFVAWRGPRQDDSWPGEVWRCERGIGNGTWVGLRSMSRSSSTESDFPTLSTQYAVGWHEETEENYDITAWLDGHIETVKETGGDSTSKYPHIQAVFSSNPYYVDCHTVWTENVGGSSYKAWYKKYRYIPRGGGGGSEAGWVRLGEDQSLLSVWPNPARARVEMEYHVPHAGLCLVRVFDVNGRAVRTLVDVDMSEGIHRATWDGRDDSGKAVARGTYYCRLLTSDSVASDILVLAE